MTRFFKVSLSVVALLLVSLLVFTGCNSETADKALTAAEEAKLAVTTATADLEAALANKADAEALANEVDKLTKAIQNAESIAEDGDASLAKAIDAAKAVLTENTQAIVSALDVKIASLLAEKADKAVVDAELARFEAVIKNINDATGAYIKVNDFVSFSSQAAIYAYQLEQRYDEMAAFEELYGNDWAKIEEAYTIAKVVIYRATSIDVINSALAQFEKVVSANANPIDALYYDYIVAYQNGEITSEEAYTNIALKYQEALATDTKVDEKLIASYYEKGNLVLIALDYWRTDLKAEMARLGSLYLVNPENTDYNDAADIVNTSNSIIVFQDAAANCNGWFGNIDPVDVPASFTDNVARMEILVNAKADADAVIALGETYTATYPDGAALDQNNINAITDWKLAYDKWVRDYLPALQNHQKNDEAAQARYNALASLVAPTEESLNAAVEALKGLAGAYITSAEEAFMKDLRDNFYTENALDPARVGYFSKPVIDAIVEKAEAWAAENNKDLVLPAFVFDSAYASKPNAAYVDLQTVVDTFGNKAAPVITWYTNLPHAGIADEVESGVANIYSAEAYFILSEVALLEIEWGENTVMVLSDDVKIEKAYLETLETIAAQHKVLVEYKLAKKAALLADVNAITGTEIYSEIAAVIDELTALFNAYVSGEHTDLPEGVTAAQLAYDNDNWNNQATLNGVDIYDLSIDVAGIQAVIDAAKARLSNLDEIYATLQARVADLQAVEVSAAYPYINVTAIEYDEKISLVNDAITAFINANGVKEEVEFAETAVAFAEDVYVATLAGNLNAFQLGELPSYFEINPRGMMMYRMDLQALTYELGVYKASATAKADVIAYVEAAIATAENLLVKEQLIYRYIDLANVYKAALAEKLSGETLEAAVADIDARLTKYKKLVHAYTFATLEAAEEQDNANYTAFEYTDLYANYGEFVYGSGEEETPVEKDLELSVDSLGLSSQKYNSGSAEVNGIGFEYIQIGNYGDGLQMRDKNGNTSKLWNTTAFGKGIVRIELVYSDSKDVTYSNANAVIFTFGNAVGDAAYTVKLSTTAGEKSYVITPDVDTYTFFSLEHDLGYTFYWKSITIVYADGTTEDITPEEPETPVVPQPPVTVDDVVLSVDSLGLNSQSYNTGSAEVNGIGFEYIQIGNYGDGLQMRDKNGNTSRLWNTTAFSAGIAKIELVYSDTKDVTHSNANAVIFTFGNAAEEATYTTKLSTTAGEKSYVITPDAETYTFFKLEHDLGYTFYWKSITIVFTDGSTISL